MSVVRRIEVLYYKWKKVCVFYFQSWVDSLNYYSSLCPKKDIISFQCSRKHHGLLIIAGKARIPVDLHIISR